MPRHTRKGLGGYPRTITFAGPKRSAKGAPKLGMKTGAKPAPAKSAPKSATKAMR